MIRKLKQHGLLLTVFAASFFHTTAYADLNDAGTKVKWGYIGNIGPTNWSHLDPSFTICSTGQAQAPINILKKVKKSKDALTLNYHAAPLILMDDGPTELMIGDTQTIVNEGHGIQVNFPANESVETITWNGESYRLVQFHIHTPSETLWRGQSYPMEIHFVHQGEKGHLAVIAVLVKGGSPNTTLQQIIDNLPQEEGKPWPVEGQTVNPFKLMPASLDHYSFAGSLTTPPCSEGVQWLVMSEAITASPAQIVKLRAAASGANARPVQPLNGRVISYSVK